MSRGKIGGWDERADGRRASLPSPPAADSFARQSRPVSSTIQSNPSVVTHLLIDTTPSGVRTITLDRPERLNAVNAALAAELPIAVGEAAGDDAVRVVVITGAGRGFCAGLDLSDPARLPGGSRAERLDSLAWVGRWVLSLVSCEKHVIAAVNRAAARALTMATLPDCKRPPWPVLFRTCAAMAPLPRQR